MNNNTTKLFIGNLPFSSTEEDVRCLVQNFGVVSHVTMITDRESGKFRGFCFVDMESQQSANEAILGLNGREVGSRPRKLQVELAKPRYSR